MMKHTADTYKELLMMVKEHIQNNPEVKIAPFEDDPVHITLYGYKASDGTQWEVAPGPAHTVGAHIHKQVFSTQEERDQLFRALAMTYEDEAMCLEACQ